MLTLECENITLDDGSVVAIGKKFERPKDIIRAIVRATYQAQLDKGLTSSIAQMQTAILLGYESQSAVQKSLAEKL
jgi:hypothetical protein